MIFWVQVVLGEVALQWNAWTMNFNANVDKMSCPVRMTVPTTCKGVGWFVKAFCEAVL